jgi:hypothetical protein
MPLDEDLTRYTAPPDNPPEEPTYLISQILRYVESLEPHPNLNHRHYTLDNIRNLLKEAAANLTDEDHGIETI